MMRLYYSKTSHFSRKVRVCILEKSLSDRVELILCNPFQNGDILQQMNPLSKVPMLVLKDGTSLYDSPVICEYLDGLNSTPQLIPEFRKERFNVLRLQAISDGIMDATFAIATERFRTDAEQSLSWLGRWQSAIERSLDALELEVSGIRASINLGQIAIACALGQLDFRMHEFVWRSDRPKLAHWFAQFEQRESMQVTIPIQ